MTVAPTKATGTDMIKRIALVLIVIGIFVTTYLSYLKFSQSAAVCVEGAAFNCEVVLNSIYSEIFDIPIAYLGLLMYLTLGALFLLENRVGFLQEYGKILMFGIALFAWVFSMYLVYLQVAVLQALCPWCLTHETVMTILFGLITYRLFRSLQDEE
ncbi:MAG: vitamin K epoxide reductase family protein [Anaerolineae bacterium]|nr:vitamin K epoxide reductase family protein [Anaerolineae bacterium]MCA9896356.1 vitamin K epoxide reductase family protein [Anaerolineae bacterium]MCB9459556.1 vitamin K epoxide reductase family protein [Anaerolineaceae bacterium]